MVASWLKGSGLFSPFFLEAGRAAPSIKLPKLPDNNRCINNI